MSGLGHRSFYTHERCSFGRLFVGRSRTGHSTRLWRDVLHGCIELICVLLPVCLLQVESSPERYCLHGDRCIHLHSNGSMLGAWYWFHHNLVAAPSNSVGSKDDVRVVPSPPSTTVEIAGKLGVVDQAQSLVLCPVLYQYAISDRRSIAPCRTVAVEVPNDHLVLISNRSQWLVERETFTWWFVALL